MNCSKLCDNTVIKLQKYKLIRECKKKRKKRGKRGGKILRLKSAATSISFLHWNIEGYTNAAQLEEESHAFQQSDIVALSETFLLNTPEINQFYVFSHNAMKKERGRPFGGILIATKQHLKPQEIKITANFIIVKTLVGYILTFYFPPYTDLDHLLEEISDALSYVDLDERIIISGDFNCRIDIDIEKGRELQDTFSSYGLALLNDKNTATYISKNGSSSIDLIFSNSPRTTSKLNII